MPIDRGAGLVLSVARRRCPVGAVGVWLSAPAPASAPSPVTRRPLELLLRTDRRERRASESGRRSRCRPTAGRSCFRRCERTSAPCTCGALEQADATVIPGTEGGGRPFFSPDGRWVGYWAGGRNPESAPGGRTTCAPVGSGSRSSVPAGTRTTASCLPASRAASGGALSRRHPAHAHNPEPRARRSQPSSAARLARRRRGSRTPSRRIAFRAGTKRRSRCTRVTGISKVVVEGGADARYVSRGHLVYVREGVLLAAPFDLERLEVTGGQVGVVADGHAGGLHPRARLPTPARGSSRSRAPARSSIVREAHPPRPNDRSCRSIERDDPRLCPLPRAFVTLRRSPDGQQIALSTFGRDRGVWRIRSGARDADQAAAAGRNSVAHLDAGRRTDTFAAGGTSGVDGLHSVRADGGGSPELLSAASSTSWPARGRPMHRS